MKESSEKLKRSFLRAIQYLSVTVHGEAKREQIQPFEPEGRVLNLHESELRTVEKYCQKRKNGLFQRSHEKWVDRNLLSDYSEKSEKLTIF